MSHFPSPTFFNLLSLFTTDSSCQEQITRHDGDSLCMNSTQVGIFKQRNQVCLRCFLKSKNCIGLESQIWFVVLSNFSHQSLERQLSNQQFSRFLVLSDFSERYSTRLISVWLFESSLRRCSFTSSFCSQLLSWSFSSCRFTSGMFGTCLKW